jgi:hypothetical protein
VSYSSEPPPGRQEFRPLSVLADQIREAHKLVQEGTRSVLRIALDCGDALLEAKAQAPAGGWQRWLRERCSLSVRSAQVYVRLAEHSEAVEIVMAELPELSLRAALKLIASKEADHQDLEGDEPPKPKSDTLDIFLAAWEKMGALQRCDALAAIGLDAILKVMPPDWRPQLERRLAGQVISLVKAQNPNLRVKRLKLALVKDTGSQISPSH